MSIPYELYPMSFFNGAVNPLHFCYLTQIKDGKENLRILVGEDKALPLYCNDNGSPKESKITKEEFMKFRHLAELERGLYAVPYDYFDIARISLNNLTKYLGYED